MGHCYSFQGIWIFNKKQILKKKTKSLMVRVPRIGKAVNKIVGYRELLVPLNLYPQKRQSGPLKTV